MFIIVKNDLFNNNVEYIKHYDLRNHSIETMMGIIDKDYDKNYYKKLRTDTIVDIYKVNRGYLYNDKQLKYVYQILQVNDKGKLCSIKEESYVSKVKNGKK